jgi:hypothetical protein
MYAPLISMVNNLVDNILVLFVFIAISMFYRYKIDSITSTYKSDLKSLKTQLDVEVKRIDAGFELLEKSMQGSIFAMQNTLDSKHQELRDVAQARYETIMNTIKYKEDNH